MVNTNGGVFDKCDKESRKFKIHRYVPSNPAGISSNVVLVMLEDHEERLWVSVSDALELSISARIVSPISSMRKWRR